jgi:hypothetical protein
MPTVRPRYQITETDEVARAIDAAAAKWPGEPRSRLLVRVIAAGGEVLNADAELAKRRAALERLRGSLSDAYPPGYLEELRSDWPE